MSCQPPLVRRRRQRQIPQRSRALKFLSSSPASYKASTPSVEQANRGARCNRALGGPARNRTASEASRTRSSKLVRRPGSYINIWRQPLASPSPLVHLLSSCLAIVSWLISAAFSVLGPPRAFGMGYIYVRVAEFPRIMREIGCATAHCLVVQTCRCHQQAVVRLLASPLNNFARLFSSALTVACCARLFAPALLHQPSFAGMPA